MMRDFNNRKLRDVAGIQCAELDFLNAFRDAAVTERVMGIVMRHLGECSDAHR